MVRVEDQAARLLHGVAVVDRALELRLHHARVARAAAEPVAVHEAERGERGREPLREERESEVK